jgi:hypothetical protein
MTLGKLLKPRDKVKACVPPGFVCLSLVKIHILKSGNIDLSGGEVWKNRLEDCTIASPILRQTRETRTARWLPRAWHPQTQSHRTYSLPRHRQSILHRHRSTAIAIGVARPRDIPAAHASYGCRSIVSSSTVKVVDDESGADRDDLRHALSLDTVRLRLRGLLLMQLLLL